MTTEQEASDTRDLKAEKNWLGMLPILVSTVAIGLVVSYAISFGKYGWSTQPESWGQFGDFLGGALNPLISLFTLTVAVKVWRLQKTELRESRNALEEQLKTAEQQRAEARFFDLLNLYQLTLASISKSVEGGRISDPSTLSRIVGQSAAYATVVTGRSALQHIFSFAVRRFFTAEKSNADVENVNDAWRRATTNWHVESEQIDHYFRTVFMVLREAEATLGSAHHYRYVKMFRAQLSREELALLGFKMVLDFEGEKMHEVAIKYGILKHLPKNLLRQEVEKKINPLVFGRNFVKNEQSTEVEP